MNQSLQVAGAPAKPLLIYDGNCRFCTFWIRRWHQATGERVDYLPFQDSRVSARFPEVPRDQFETAVRLIETNGHIYCGAAAAFRALAQNPRKRWPLRCYERWPIFARVAECSYRFVAGHRAFFSALTRLT